MEYMDMLPTESVEMIPAAVNIVNPTWDLFIIIVGVMILAYSFIIGRETSIKFIIATYISLLASDGLVTTIHKYFFSNQSLIDGLPTFTEGSPEIILSKIVTFLLLTVFLAMKGNFEATENEMGSMFNFLYATIFGTLSACLIITGLLSFISGGSFISTFLSHGISQAPSISMQIYNQSQIARMLVDHSSIVFAAPAIILLISALGGGEEE